ncbi:MAG: bacterioferritin-associated ferredoxin [Pseudomonadota bacterium]
MYICICNSVTDKQIRTAVAAGAETLDDLRDSLGVASCCGTCACAAQALLDGPSESASERALVRAETRTAALLPAPGA